ncbi:MAG: 2OG-Fe dioxygenase family protein, partial [Acetobacteraceae bacterium]|nr:2OG-Fe dioxygenase family protein [Acetobacteraceae bacterium]
MSGADPLAPLADAVARDGFNFVRGAEMRAALARAGSLDDWDRFAASWDDLGVDTYMADGGRYRKRRHAVYGVGPDGIRHKPHQAHYQSRDYNKLNGGIARWFEPVLPEIGAGPSMTTVL